MTIRQILLGAIKARSAVSHIAKQRKSKVPRQRFPNEAVLSYKKALIGAQRTYNQRIRDILYPKLDKWFPKETATIRKDSIEDDLDGFNATLDHIKEVFADIDSRTSAAASAVAGVIDRVNKAQISNQFKVMTGVDVEHLMPGIAKTIEDFVATNVSLIRSIPADRLSELHAILVDANDRGLHSSSIKDQIEDRFSVSESRATLIARDQVGKLNADLTKDRQTSLGVTSFEWKTLEDERVRPMHQDLDGQTFSWDDPPITNEAGDTNLPGQDFQCWPGWTNFVEFDVIRRFYYRRYSGRLIEIELEGGGSFKVTPNHPIYTKRGWVPAKEITDIDSLAYVYRPFDDRTFYDMHRQFQKFEDLHPFSDKPGQSTDFHGDGQETPVFKTELRHSVKDHPNMPDVKVLKGREYCKVEKTSFVGFAGYVFNIETKCGYYGIQTGGKTFLSKNCRCLAIPNLDELFG